MNNASIPPLGLRAKKRGLENVRAVEQHSEQHSLSISPPAAIRELLMATQKDYILSVPRQTSNEISGQSD